MITPGVWILIGVITVLAVFVCIKVFAHNPNVPGQANSILNRFGNWLYSKLKGMFKKNAS